MRPFLFEDYYTQIVRNPYDAKASARVRNMTATERIFARAGANAEDISVAASRAKGMQYDGEKEVEAYKYGLEQRKKGNGEALTDAIDKAASLDRKSESAIMELKDDERLLKAYQKSIEIGELSPLVNFDIYKKYDTYIDEKLIGTQAKNGIIVRGKAYHFTSRVIGSIENRRNGVELEEILITLQNPVDIRAIRIDSNGKSQKFIGQNAIVTINPDTGILIQVNPL